MPWSNILTDYPDAELQVIDLGAGNSVVPPANYAALGITLSATDGVVTFAITDPNAQYIPAVRLPEEIRKPMRISFMQADIEPEGFHLDDSGGISFSGVDSFVGSGFDSFYPFLPIPLNVVPDGNTAPWDAAGVYFITQPDA